MNTDKSEDNLQNTMIIQKIKQEIHPLNKIKEMN